MGTLSRHGNYSSNLNYQPQQQDCITPKLRIQRTRMRGKNIKFRLSFLFEQAETHQMARLCPECSKHKKGVTLQQFISHES